VSPLRRVCLVTGANRGIGRATAEGLARAGATVVAVARDAARGEEAVAAIRAATGNGAVHLLVADLSSADSIRELGAAFRERFDALHVLVNNAGLFLNERRTSAGGHEMTLAVNHLGYFRLTHELLDLLRAGAPSRVVNVASEAHRGARLDPDDLHLRNGYDGMTAYANSKLLNVLFTYELARRLERSGVTANCLHPGVIRTHLLAQYGRGLPWALRWMTPLFLAFLPGPEKGARTSLHVATSAALEGVQGLYFKDSREIRSSADSYDRALATRIWDMSCAMTGIAW
jgi:NAD(P)-dependent dehydrogenase (short-subunit alcohol dehydrogenase family)